MYIHKPLGLLAILLPLFIALANCQCSKEDTCSPSIERIRQRGFVRIGTTGDYRPLSYKDPSTGEYSGADIDIALSIANRIGVRAQFIQTSWPSLTEDVLCDTLFDFAIGGITITDARKEIMDMSDGYMANGKTILCRKEDVSKFTSLESLNTPDVRVMVNPGGLNEKFARANLPNSTLIVYDRNEEIPAQIADGKADVMITEITEAPYYVNADTRLAAPLLSTPFTHGEIGALLHKGQDDLLDLINSTIASMKADGSLRQIHENYNLQYAYE